jgi:hypothetical protein
VVKGDAVTGVVTRVTLAVQIAVQPMEMDEQMVRNLGRRLLTTTTTTTAAAAAAKGEAVCLPMRRNRVLKLLVVAVAAVQVAAVHASPVHLVQLEQQLM